MMKVIPFLAVTYARERVQNTPRGTKNKVIGNKTSRAGPAPGA